MNSLFQMVANGIGIQNRHGIFGDGPDDTDDVSLLKAHLPHAPVGHQIRPLDLARKKKCRGGIDPGGGHARDGICAAGSGGHQRNAEIIGVLPIGIRCNGAGLIVKIADVFNLLASSHGIHKMHTPTAGKHENMFNLLSKTLDNVI